MTTQNTAEVIKSGILKFYTALENSDETTFRSLVHPEVRTVNIGNENQPHIFNLDQIIQYTLQGRKQAKESTPGFYANWENIIFKNIYLKDVIAMVNLTYEMKMPDSIGYHSCGIHLLFQDEKWQIIQIIDRGLESPGIIDDSNRHT